MILKIGCAKKIITPKTGCLLAGYGSRIVSKEIHDSLFISGIYFQTGSSQALLLSYDLLGLDEDTVHDIRLRCSKKLGLKPSQIVLTCTHTHSGPHTRRISDMPFDQEYVDGLKQLSVEAAASTVEKLISTEVYHYSAKCFENVNRRIQFPDHSCINLPEYKELEKLADGITDPELGILYFCQYQTGVLIATLVNYAAHPLTCQSGGEASLKISSDYPGVIRDSVEKQLGGICVFTSGACGNLHPKGFESGFERTEQMGKSMAEEVVKGFTVVQRQKNKYHLDSSSIETRCAKVELSKRKKGCREKTLPLYRYSQKIVAEVQFFRLGSCCFVGVPGEVLTEFGLEVKWHSPFKKTFILYNSTAYLSYIPHANAYVGGSYEVETSHFSPYSSFNLLSKIVEEFQTFKTSIQ